MSRFLKPNVDAESNDPVWVMPDVPEIEIAIIYTFGYLALTAKQSAMYFAI